MNPFIKKALGSVISIVVTAAATWLIAQGYLTADEGGQLIAILTAAGLVAAQRVWKKRGDQQELLTAMALGPTSRSNVKATVDAGMAPAVNTPAGVIPQLTNTVAPSP
jgi:low temperature requirement protein LtrA